MVIQIDRETLEEVRKMFRNLEGSVILRFFRPSGECRFCEDTEKIVEILSSLSDKISYEIREEGSSLADKFNVDMFPALLVHGEKEYNVRFFGIPAGYEFGALIEDIIDVSRGRPSLSEKLAKIVAEKIKKRVRIMVFVTPTCPYCPLAVRTAHKLAMANPLITGDMIEALEFEELANQYSVYAVPKNVIKVDGEDALEFEGAAPDPYFIAQIFKALKEPLLEEPLDDISNSEI